MTVSHHGGSYPFLADGAVFTKYHQQPSLFNYSGKRLVFYQHNVVFWVRPGVGRPRPGEEHTVEPAYQSPLTHIIAVQAGKHGNSFTQSRQAAAVADERAWSMLVRRKDGREEHVDLEASSREERDKWVRALQSLSATAKRTELERDSRTRWVELVYRVDGQGQVTVTVEPAAAQSDSAPVSNAGAAATTGAPLTVATGAAAASALKLPKTDDDTPSPAHSPAPTAATHTSTSTADSAHSLLSSADVVITDGTSATSQRSIATSTTGLPSASSGPASAAPHPTDSRLTAALDENERLKERIAELEEQLKGTHVDSVPAS